jgi:hypothetical protein
MRERTLAYFEYQQMIDDIWSRKRFTIRDWIARLDKIVTETDLETLAVWQLGNTVDEQRAVARLVARGEPRWKYRRQLAIQALAERKYGLAARYLETKPGKAIRDSGQFYLRLYALCMAGKVREAERAAVAGLRWLPADAEGELYLAWLNERFDFEPPERATPVDGVSGPVGELDEHRHQVRALAQRVATVDAESLPRHPTGPVR